MLPATRAGAEALIHKLEAATARPSTRVLAVDGIGCQAMLQELRRTPRGPQPDCRSFASSMDSLSRFVWTAYDGTGHLIQQAEGGEQSDPLMPALFAFGIAPALRKVQAGLCQGQHVLAFVDNNLCNRTARPHGRTLMLGATAVGVALPGCCNRRLGWQPVAASTRARLPSAWESSGLSRICRCATSLAPRATPCSPPEAPRAP